jgi:preprotein translocase subunit SecD
MKLSGLVPMQALGMASRSHKLVKEAEEMCPKCGKPMAQCECMGEDMDKNVANGLPQTQGDEKKLTLSREHFKNIVREVMKEEGEYQKVFHKLLNKFGVKSPAELSDEQKKKFFSLAKGIQTELAERAKIKEAELSAGQKKLDVDGDGEIEGSDLAKLRSKNESKKKK